MSWTFTRLWEKSLYCLHLMCIYSIFCIVSNLSAQNCSLLIVWPFCQQPLNGLTVIIAVHWCRLVTFVCTDVELLCCLYICGNWFRLSTAGQTLTVIDDVPQLPALRFGHREIITSWWNRCYHYNPYLNLNIGYVWLITSNTKQRMWLLIHS